ncbi:MAG: SBBP repeat-containing protein [Bacteroidia bacterium]
MQGFMKSIQKVLVFVISFMFISIKTLHAIEFSNAQQALSKLDKNYFIENKGQWHSDVLYLARLGGLDAWITKYGVNYTFYKLEEIPNESIAKKGRFPDKIRHKDYNVIGHRVLMKLQNYNSNSVSEGKQKQEGYYNYFIGNDDSKHASFVRLYNEVLIKNIYNGIDIRYYFDKGFLRFDYIVHPGAEPNQIVFSLKGSEKTYVNEKGNLVFKTRFGETSLTELNVYQQDKRNTISSSFKAKSKDLWTFQINSYDRTKDLIIDPLIYSTYIGGSNLDEANGIEVDGNGNAYITGDTYSTEYDILPGAFQYTIAGWVDVFITKLNTLGNALIYSTYIGGNGDDIGYDVKVDGNGNTFITGITSSTNYDITTGAYQTTNDGGDYDVFVTKINSNGSSLLYSTYLGGSDLDVGLNIAIDATGSAYVTGYTYSNNFDITAGAFQTSMAGFSDAFVTKLNSTGNALVYSTYIGGSDYEFSYGLIIDNTGNTYIVGQTLSTDFDITLGAFQTIYGGNCDVFVTKLNSNGNSLEYSTYIGGSDEDFGYSIALDNNGNTYITGYTWSTDFDITTGAFQNSNQGSCDAFITKLNFNGSSLEYSTYLGGGDWDFGKAITIDGNGNIYITGWTQSINFDTTPGAFQTIYGGGTYDVFVTKFNPSGSGLIYSTYLGGNDIEFVSDIDIDANGNAYLTGYTSSTNFDITSGAFQTNFEGFYDVFVTKICFESIALISANATTNQSVCINVAISNIVYIITGATGVVITGLPSGVSGNFNGSNLTISGTPNQTGIFNYTVTLTGGCGSVITNGTITVNPNISITLSSSAGTDNQTLCINTPITNITYSASGATGASVSGLPSGVNSNFSGGVVTISGTPTLIGTFNYTITPMGGCGNVSAIGSITVNDCLGIDQMDNQTSWSIYPNPAKHQFTIKTENGGLFELLDIQGRVLQSFSVNNNQETISLNYSPGMYFIREQKSGFVQKVIIE